MAEGDELIEQAKSAVREDSIRQAQRLAVPETVSAHPVRQVRSAKGPPTLQTDSLVAPGTSITKSRQD